MTRRIAVLRPARSDIFAIALALWTIVAIVAVTAFTQPAHADTPPTRGEGRTEGSRSTDRELQRTPTIALPDCTRDQKHGTNGIVREGDRAVWVVELSADCVVGLSSFDKPGPRGQLVETAVASGRGTHTLSVRACAQVDAHAGPTFERDADDKFTSETYEETCEVPPSTTTTSNGGTTSSVPGTTTPPTSPPSTTVVSVPGTSCVPDCENPDAPEHVPPELAYGGPDPVTDAVALAFPFVLAAGLAFVVVGRAEG